MEGFAAATAREAAPLEIVSQDFTWRVSGVVAVGAMTAMLGVLLNLLLGLSRVLLAMGRRGDLPHATGNFNVSIVTICCAIAVLAATGSVKTAWALGLAVLAMGLVWHAWRVRLS